MSALSRKPTAALQSAVNNHSTPGHPRIPNAMKPQQVSQPQQPSMAQNFAQATPAFQNPSRPPMMAENPMQQYNQNQMAQGGGMPNFQQQMQNQNQQFNQGMQGMGQGMAGMWGANQQQPMQGMSQPMNFAQWQKSQNGG